MPVSINHPATIRPLTGLLLACALGLIPAAPRVQAAGTDAATGAPTLDERFTQADQALNDGRISDGEAVLKAILAEYPRNKDAANLLGNLALAQGRLDAAKAFYNQALDADPAAAETYNNLGVLALQQKDVNGAMVNFQTAVRLDPARADAWYNLGQVYLGGGNQSEGERCLRKAIDADPKQLGARYRLAVLLLGTQRGDQAVPLLEELIRIAPDDAKSLFLLATVNDDLGRTAAARDGYVKARAAGSTNPRLGLYLAQAQAKLKQTAEARRELEALLATPASDPQVRKQASDLLRSLGNEQTR
jgi:tetratricopeptide (TPR) repeat protein